MVFNIVVSYCCKRKMLKRNNRLFCHIFVIGEISIERDTGPLSPPPLATPMLQVRKTKKMFANFTRGFWRFPTKFQLFKKQCCSRAEDKAIFEDLRLRGQGHPRGLHLCKILLQNTKPDDRSPYKVRYFIESTPSLVSTLYSLQQ